MSKVIYIVLATLILTDAWEWGNTRSCENCVILGVVLD